MSPNGAVVGWGRMPNWLGYIRPFADRLDIRWPVLWSEAAADARPLPFPTSFTDRFWDAMEHWEPDVPGTDPYGIKVWKGGVPAVHSGLPIGTEAEFTEGLLYSKWIAGEYASRTMPDCHLVASETGKVRKATRMEAEVHSALKQLASVRAAAQLEARQTASITLHETIRGSKRLYSTEYGLRYVRGVIRKAARLESTETSTIGETASVRKAAALVSVETFAVTVSDVIRKASVLNVTETYDPGYEAMWTKYTLPYTDFQTGATSITVAVASIGPNDYLHDVALNVTTNFTGGSIVAATGTLKYDTSAISTGLNFFTGLVGGAASAQGFVSKVSMPTGTNMGKGSFSGSKNVNLTLSVSGANLSALTAGSVDVWLNVSAMP